MAVGGWLGFVLAVSLLLCLHLRVAVELESGRPTTVKAGLLGVDLVYRSTPGRPGASRAKASGSGGGTAVGRSLRALRVLLDPLRQVPVRNAQVIIRGGTGDAAATAVLYGAVWAALSTWVKVSGTEPKLLRVEPTLEGPPDLWAKAGAQVSLPIWRLLLGGCRAMRTMGSGRG